MTYNTSLFCNYIYLHINSYILYNLTYYREFRLYIPIHFTRLSFSMFWDLPFSSIINDLYFIHDPHHGQRTIY